MWRLKNDRGAVGVMVAILIPALLACTALVVDVGALYLRRSELQNAADAAALAIAQDCAGPSGCLTPTVTASNLVTANAGPSASTDTPAIGNGFVTVTARSTVNYLFAPVIGISSKVVTATGSAGWVAISGGPAILPIAFSKCSFTRQSSGQIDPTGPPTSVIVQTIYLPKDSTGCTGRSGLAIPGGFGWLNSPASCFISVAVGGTVGSKTGRPVPSNCDPVDFSNQHNQTVLLPIYDDLIGSNYHIYAFAAFHLTGYSFEGQYNWPSNPKVCKGEESCIRGYFTSYVPPPLGFTYGGSVPDLGARLVKLCVPGVNCS